MTYYRIRRPAATQNASATRTTNILKTFDYQFQASTGCGGNCFSIPMQTLAGTATLSYPVGVFNIHGKLLGNAATPVAYTNLWNSDTADTRLGSLVVGTDSPAFQDHLECRADPAGQRHRLQVLPGGSALECPGWCSEHQCRLRGLWRWHQHAPGQIAAGHHQFDPGPLTRCYTIIPAQL